MIVVPRASGAQHDALEDGGEQIGLSTPLGRAADLFVVEQRKYGADAGNLFGTEQGLQPGEAGDLVVESRS